MNFILIFLAASCFCLKTIHGYSVHFVTYNVKDNLLMPDYEISDKIAAEILFIREAKTEKPKDIYVVALQENCHNCDSKNLNKIAKLFLNQLKQLNEKYVLIGLVATRDTNFCEKVSCNPFASQHGTSLIMVFSLKEIVKGFDIRKRVRCMAGYVRNSEKGLAGMQLHMENGKKLCFVAGHLDAGGIEGRRKCIADYFGDKKSHGIPFKWLFQSNNTAKDEEGAVDVGDSNSFKNCDSIFLAGDFNTRTGKKDIALDDEETDDGTLVTEEELQNILEFDEFSGSAPYTGENLLQIIKDATQRTFQEPMRPIKESKTFVPTYSLLPKKRCNGQGPCYSRERPISWTDRIACHNCGEVKYYSSLGYMHSLSDHLPVVGVFDNL
jgi:hypothetical protein